MLPDWDSVEFFSFGVIPAKAETHYLKLYKGLWVPAFAGMSGKLFSGMGAKWTGM